MAGISFKQRGDPPPTSGTSNGQANGTPVSISFSSSKKPSHASNKHGKKRPLSSLIDDDEPEPTQKIEEVSGFASGKVITGKEHLAPVKKALVITGSKNKDWREESRKRKRGHLPAEEQARRNGIVAKDEDVKEEEVTYGLILQDKKAKPSTADVDADVEMVEETPKTADEEALSALLSEKKSSTLVLSGNVQNERFTARAREDAAFLSDVASRPDGASLEEYAAVPIGEFGAALLRGMGWREGESVGRRRRGADAKQVQVTPKVAAPPRRGGVLGIGAKEVPGEVVDEVGAWGKGARDKRKVVGVPMVMRNKVTGETISEEELVRRREGEGVVLEGEAEGKRGERGERKRREERDEKERGGKDRERERNGHRKDKERRRDERDSKRDRDREREREKDRDRERSHEHRRRDEKRRDRDRDEDRHRRR